MILFFDQIIDRPNNKSINIQLYKIELSQNLSGKIIQKNIIIIYNSYNIKYDKILDFYRFFKKSDSLQIFSTPMFKENKLKEIDKHNIELLIVMKKLKEILIFLLMQKF